MSSVSDLAAFADMFAPLWRHKLAKHWCSTRWGAKTASKVSFKALMEICAEFFAELRKYGRWRMVEVVTDDISVYLDFY